MEAEKSATSLDGLFDSGSRAWSFLPQITLPIFRGGALRANLDVAQVQKRIEIANYEKAIQVAFSEVADGLAGKRTLDDQIRSEQLLVAASQSAKLAAGQGARAASKQRASGVRCVARGKSGVLPQHARRAGARERSQLQVLRKHTSRSQPSCPGRSLLLL